MLLQKLTTIKALKRLLFVTIINKIDNHQKNLLLIISNRRISNNRKLYPMAPYPRILEQQPDDMSKFPIKQKWKEAASLIIIASENNQQQNINNNPKLSIKFDYKTLMVKRSSQSSFFASAYVFPGGQVELSDFDYKWYELFEKFGIKRNKLDRISNEIVGPRPPMVTNPITLREQSSLDLKKIIHMDIGLRISAIRETFEEAGILLLVDPKNYDKVDYCNVLTSKSLNFDLIEWQKKVRSDAKIFFLLCDQLKMVPNVWALYEWSNWLTPVNVGHRRFDTMFYVCCFNEKPPVNVDDAEVTTPIWCNPIEILEEHRKEEVFLAPPQVYELSRFLSYPVMNELFHFMNKRQALGCQRWLPIIYSYDDGAFSLVPGDEQYPNEPQLMTNSKQVPEINGSIYDISPEIKSKNRMEIIGIRCRAFCTIEPGCGHIVPITYPPDDNNNNRNSKTIAKL